MTNREQWAVGCRVVFSALLCGSVGIIFPVTSLAVTFGFIASCTVIICDVIVTELRGRR